MAINITNISTSNNAVASSCRCKDTKDKRSRMLQECLSNSAGQALVKMFKSQSSLVVKIFWFACLTCTCSLCAYFIIESLILYFTPVSNTLLHTHYENVSLFPRVTLCNKNFFTTKYAYEMANNMSYDEFIYHVNTRLDKDGHQLKLLQHSLDDILFDCQFNQVSYWH